MEACLIPVQTPGPCRKMRGLPHRGLPLGRHRHLAGREGEGALWEEEETSPTSVASESGDSERGARKSSSPGHDGAWASEWGDRSSRALSFGVGLCLHEK